MYKEIKQLDLQLAKWASLQYSTYNY